MKTRSRKAIPGALAALLLCAAFGAARAGEAREEQATVSTVSVRSVINEETDEQAAARALAVRRQEMIDDCEVSHGSEVDCERETDTELRAEGLLVGGGVNHLRPPR